MNLIFLGYVVNKEIANQQKGASVAGNNMQLNILKNLNDIKDLNLSSITIYPTQPFPKGLVYIKSTEITIFNSFKTLSIGFLNLPFIKQVNQAFNMFKYSRRVIKKNNIDTILTYNMYPQVGIPAILLKKIYGIHLISILADPPIEIKKKTIFQTYMNRIFMRITKMAIKSCSRIIVLNKFAADKYAPGLEYEIIQGGISAEIINEKKKMSSNYNFSSLTTKKIIFTGALTEYNGIIELVEAMKKIRHLNVILHIYGDGNLKEYVKNKSKDNPNIKYFGKKSNIDVIRQQSEAFLLINPRKVNDEISKVTFPSKIFEYMISGTPILSSRLNGYTEDYLDKMYFIDDFSPEGIANKITEIYFLSNSEREKMASKAKEYVIGEKNWKKQTSIIYNFLKGSMGE